MTHSLEQQIQAHQVRSIYSHTYTLAVSHPVAAMLIAWIFRNAVELYILFPWLAAVALVATSRIPFFLQFKRQKHDEQKIQLWRRAFLITSVCQACLYGAAWAYLIPIGNPVFSVLAGMLMVGLSTTALVGYASDRAAMLSFFLPVIVPGFASYLLVGGMLNYALALALLLYTLVSLKTVHPVHRSIIRGIELNFRLQEEIKERAKAEEQLRILSFKDGLTGLANRRFFDDTLLDELHRAARVDNPISLLLLDVDFFKHFNDTYGHVEGDKCLQKIAASLEHSVKRSGELVARFGGEEFAIILPNIDEVQADEIAKRVHSAVRALAIPHKATDVEGEHTVTVSIGCVTLVPDANTDPQQLIHQTDLALYQAKANGRNQTSFFSPAE